jgi:hypothetical protein
MQIKIIGTRKLFNKPQPRHMKKFASILFLFSTLNLFGQTPAPLAIKPSKKYTLQIDAGVNCFRYRSFSRLNGNAEISVSHYEAITIDRKLNPTFSVSLGIRNTNYGYKTHIDAFDELGNLLGSNIVAEWNYWTIQTPIQIKIKPFKSKKLSLNAGGYLGYNYFNSVSNSISVNKIQRFYQKNLLDKGIIVGVDYDWFKRGDFTIGNSLTYYRGYAYLNRYAFEYYKSRSHGITIGCTAKWGF